MSGLNRIQKTGVIFGDELRVLVNRAYPDLQDEVRESIMLTDYLDQIKNHQIAFWVRQQCPKSLVEAVRATIELESYLPKSKQVAPMQGLASVRDNQSLVSVIEKLTERVEKLEGKLNDRTVSRKQRQTSHQPRPDYREPIICLRCGQPGHFARAVPRVQGISQWESQEPCYQQIRYMTRT